MNRGSLLISLALGFQLIAWGQRSTTQCTTQANLCAHRCGGVGQNLGCFDQCMSQLGCGGGRTPTPTPTPAGVIGGMDVLPHTPKSQGTAGAPDRQWDDNNFLRNPVWRFAKFQNGQAPNVCAFCPCNNDTAYGWNTMPTCTSQSIYKDSSFLCGYHMNWFPVEYEGFLEWGGKSPFYDDEDYYLAIHRDRDNVNDHALETSSRPGVHIEFDSRETVNHFDGTQTWWDWFHHNAVDNSDAAASQAINDKYAIVVGLAGIDSQHDAHSELHPVYAIFVKLPGSGPAQDRWTFFVRNFGNEGYCGSDDPIPNQQLQVRIPGSGGSIVTGNRGVLASSNVWLFSDDDIDQCADTQWSHEPSTDGGLLFTFNLSDSARKCGFVGDLTINWQGSVFAAAAAVRGAQSFPPSHAPEVEVEDPALRARIDKLSPSDRQQLDKQIAMTEPPSKPTARRKEASPPLPKAQRPRVDATLPNYGKGLKPVVNPAARAREQKKRELIDAFLKAHGVQ